MNYKKFTILKADEGYQVLSPCGRDICGEYLPSLKLAKSVINYYIKSGDVADEFKLFGFSTYKISIDSITKK